MESTIFYVSLQPKFIYHKFNLKLKNKILMKKIFTLIALFALTLGAQAQLITWDEPVDKGSVAGTYGTGFVLTSVDNDGKQQIDANNAWFGDATAQTKYAFRLKTGGKNSSKNALTLTIPSDGKLKVYVRTGSNSATDRNVVLTQGDKELYNQIVKEADAVKVKGLDSADPEKETNVYPVIEVDVVAGDVAITYPVNGLNFYGFELVTATGVNNVKAAAAQKTGATYTLGGQQVGADYKGIVVKDGVKFVQE